MQTIAFQKKEIFQEHTHVDLFMDIGLKNPNEL
jgi:hypothetical protein